MKIKFKLDENADSRWRSPLESLGYKVSTVAEEHLRGVDDRTLAEICRTQKLCLITVDLGFAQTLEYSPRDYYGLIVLRHPKPTLSGMQNLIQQVAISIGKESPIGQLWIVEPGRIRIHGTSRKKDT